MVTSGKFDDTFFGNVVTAQKLECSRQQRIRPLLVEIKKHR
jgi:hypothetical protein